MVLNFQHKKRPSSGLKKKKNSTQRKNYSDFPCWCFHAGFTSICSFCHNADLTFSHSLLHLLHLSAFLYLFATFTRPHVQHHRWRSWQTEDCWIKEPLSYCLSQLQPASLRLSLSCKNVQAAPAEHWYAMMKSTHQRIQTPAPFISPYSAPILQQARLSHYSPFKTVTTFLLNIL